MGGVQPTVPTVLLHQRKKVVQLVIPCVGVVSVGVWTTNQMLVTLTESTTALMMSLTSLMVHGVTSGD